MTPSQTQALQEVKDEVAKKHGCYSWSTLVFEFRTKKKALTDISFMLIEEEAMQLYHTRLLAEAGRELPTDEQIEKAWEVEYKKSFTQGDLWRNGNKHMRSKASALLAAKQAEIEELKQAKVALKIMHAAEMKQRMALEAEVERLKADRDKAVGEAVYWMNLNPNTKPQ